MPIVKTATGYQIVPGGTGGGKGTSRAAKKSKKELDRLTELARKEGLPIPEEPKLSVWQRLGRGLSAFEPADAIYGKLYEEKPFVKEYALNIVKGLGSAITGKDYDKGDPKKTFKDIMVKEGWRDRPGKIDPVDIAGLAGDIFTDPTTYMGGFIGKGLSGAVKGGVNIAKKTPIIGKGVTQATDAVDLLFKPFAKIEKLGETGKAYRASYEKYVKGTRVQMDDFLEEVSKRASSVKGVPKAGEIITEAIETGAKTGNELLDSVIDDIVGSQKTFAEGEKMRGILKAEIPDYMRHMLTKEARDYMQKGGNMSALVKPIRVRLGAVKGRKILNFVSEDGKRMMGNVDNLGLSRLNREKIITGIENSASKRIEAIQEIQKKLAEPELWMNKAAWNDYFKKIKNNISTNRSIIRESLEEPAEKDFDKVINSILGRENLEMEGLLKELEVEIATSQGKEFLYKPLFEKASRKAKIVDLEKRITKLTNEVNEKVSKLSYFDYVGKGGKLYKSASASIDEINKSLKDKLGFNLFEPDAFKAYAQRGIENIQAIKTYDFLKTTASQFGKLGDEVIDETGMRWVKSTAPQLQGYVFPQPIAQHIDDFTKTLSNDEATNAFLKVFDRVQSFWKASVTGYFPSFHTRNSIGGLFNNWIAGLKDPRAYLEGENILKGKTGSIATKTGKISYEEARKLIKEYGVVGQTGMLDVAENLRKNVSPTLLDKFKNAPQKVMGAVEDRLRVPLFIDGLKKGMTAEEAAKRVVKFHFDYMPEAFTGFEKNVMKRLIPFYTWTRHNIPLQLEQMIMQPGKYAAIFKAEKASGLRPGSEEEEVLPRWLREKFAIKGEGGYWSGLGLPIEEVTEKISNPLRGLGISLSPLVKTPLEQLTGYNIFAEKKIDEDTYGKQYKNMPEPMKKWLGFKEHKTKDGEAYYTVNPHRKYWIELIGARGLSTALRLANTKDDRKNLWSLITTIKKYEYDPEDLKRWAESEKSSQIEKALYDAGLLRKFETYYEPKD